VLGPQPFFCKRSLAVEVLSGAEAGEGDDVANHVRLIAIPALKGEGWPIRCTAPANQYQRALKSSDATEQLRGDTEFLFEDRDEAALAQTDQFRNLAYSRRSTRRTESVYADMHRRMVFLPTRQLAQQRAFQESKPSLWSGFTTEAVVELDSLTSPDIREIDMRSARLTCDIADEGQRAASLEIHAQDTRRLGRVRDKGNR